MARNEGEVGLPVESPVAAIRARRRQAHRLESIGQLAGGIAHDFNNLLAVIINYAAFITERLSPGHELRRDVEEIRRAAERGAELTRQLLLFSRREAVSDRLIDLSSVVDELSRLLERTIGEGVELRSELSPDLSPVRADPGQVEQVVVNLVVNARDAMPEGGLVTISTANVELDAERPAALVALDPGSYVRLTVADNGSGMTKEVLARAFDPFYTMKPRGSGTGLGLATVYGIVAQAGGAIDVASEPGAGTTISLYLPAAERSASDAAPADVSALPARTGGQTVLLVEDDAGVREVTRRILSTAGYAVIESERSYDALLLCANLDQPVDLLLTDVSMSGLSGIELAREARGLCPGMRILFMSGYAEPSIDADLADAQTIAKPFDASSLLQRVAAVLSDGAEVRERGTLH